MKWCCLALAPLILQQWCLEARIPVPEPVSVVQDTDRPYVNTGHPRVIHFYPGDPDYLSSSPQIKMTFLHELGHVYDNTTLRRGPRARIARLFNWWWDPEKFAMGYSYCAAGLYPRDTYPWYFGYGYHPARWKTTRLCRILRAG